MNNEDLLLFGERLREKRHLLDFTQEYVAAKIGISVRFYQMIERGEKSVSLNTLIRLSQLMKISIDYLLFGDLAGTLDNPLIEIFNDLSSGQRTDAVKIMQLYAKACKQ